MPSCNFFTLCLLGLNLYLDISSPRLFYMPCLQLRDQYHSKVAAPSGSETGRICSYLSQLTHFSSGVLTSLSVGFGSAPDLSKNNATFKFLGDAVQFSVDY